MSPRQGAAAVTALVLGVLLVGAASGCTVRPDGANQATATGDTASPAPSLAPSPDAVVVEGLGLAILQNRPDYATRTLQLSVTTEGDEPVTVLAARFESPQFVAAAEWAGSAEVPAGLERRLPVALPAAVCPAPEGAASRLTVTVADGSGERTVSARPADPFGGLARIAGEDCLGEAVSAVARLRLDDTLPVSGSGPDATARLTLHVDPAPPTGTPEELELESVSPTILLDPAEGTDWTVARAVAAGDDPFAITLDAVPARCDPHAVAEDKRGTVLPVAVRLGGISGTVHVVPSEAMKQALYDFIASACGYAVEEGEG
jgi:hypothetical protein